MNRNVRCTNFFGATSRPQLDTLPPLEIIITVCHEKGRHPLPPNRDVLFEPHLLGVTYRNVPPLFEARSIIYMALRNLVSESGAI